MVIDLNQELSEHLKLLRFKSKKSQEEVAKELKITRQCYTNWENNPIKLDIETLMKVGRVLNENNILNFFTIYVAKCNCENETF